jgi:hypothetical protein
VAGDGQKQQAGGDAGTAALGFLLHLFSEKREKKGGEKERAAAARGSKARVFLGSDGLACVALVSPKEYPEMEGGRPRKRHACCVS